MKTKYTNFRNMSNDELFEELIRLTGIKDRDFMADLNAINEFILSKDGSFQVRFVRNVYLMVGHHDHQEIEAVLATAKIRILALLQTLEN